VITHYRPHDLLNVVLLLVDLEDEQGRLLDAIAAGPIITIEEFDESGHPARCAHSSKAAAIQMKLRAPRITRSPVQRDPS
jgi:hypothetical protein